MLYTGIPAPGRQQPRVDQRHRSGDQGVHAHGRGVHLEFEGRGGYLELVLQQCLPKPRGAPCDTGHVGDLTVEAEASDVKGLGGNYADRI